MVSPLKVLPGNSRTIHEILLKLQSIYKTIKEGKFQNQACLTSELSVPLSIYNFLSGAKL